MGRKKRTTTHPTGLGDSPKTITPLPGEPAPGLNADAVPSGEATDPAVETAAETAATTEPKETCKEWLRRNFTAEELLIMGRKMSEAHQQLVKLNEDLTTIKADYKSRITALEGEVSNYARMWSTGYEMTYIKCEVVRDHETKMVRICRLDTGEFVRERRMTLDEQQRSLLPPETMGKVAEHFGVDQGSEAATEGRACDCGTTMSLANKDGQPGWLCEKCGTFIAVEPPSLPPDAPGAEAEITF